MANQNSSTNLDKNFIAATPSQKAAEQCQSQQLFSNISLNGSQSLLSSNSVLSGLHSGLQETPISESLKASQSLLAPRGVSPGLHLDLQEKTFNMPNLSLGFIPEVSPTTSFAKLSDIAHKSAHNMSNTQNTNDLIMQSLFTDSQSKLDNTSILFSDELCPTTTSLQSIAPQNNAPELTWSACHYKTIHPFDISEVSTRYSHDSPKKTKPVKQNASSPIGQSSDDQLTIKESSVGINNSKANHKKKRASKLSNVNGNSQPKTVTGKSKKTSRKNHNDLNPRDQPLEMTPNQYKRARRSSTSQTPPESNVTMNIQSSGPQDHTKIVKIAKRNPVMDFDQWIAEWNQPVTIRTFLNQLAHKFSKLALEFRGEFLRNKFIEPGCNTISRDDYTRSLAQYKCSIDSIVKAFIIDERYLIWELQRRGIVPALLKYPVIAAADQGYDDLVRIFLQYEQYQDVNAKLPKTCKETRIVGDKTVKIANMAALSLACVNSQAECVREILKFNPNLCFDQSHPIPPIHLAIIQENFEICRLLIHAGAPKDQAYNGEVPLYKATESHNVEIARLLLECGADPNGHGEDKWTPLHGACAVGNLDLVRLYLNSGSSINALNKDGSSPLDIACKFLRADVCVVLSVAGADLESTDDNGWTPLHVACWKKSKEVIETLIASGSNKDARCEIGRTPLHIAAYSNHPDNCKVMIAAGANIEARDKEKWTPLHAAAFEGAYLSVQALVECGANLNPLSKIDRTPLHIAIESKHCAVYEYLIENGADKDCKDLDNLTPLHIAAIKGDPKAIKCLIDASCIQLVRSKNGLTPLHKAILFHREKVIKLFDSSLVNSQDEKGNTPLHYAIKSSKAKSIIKSLLSMNPRMIKNLDGLTPLDIAECKQDLEMDVVQLMKDQNDSFALFSSKRPKMGGKCLPGTKTIPLQYHGMHQYSTEEEEDESSGIDEISGVGDGIFLQ